MTFTIDRAKYIDSGLVTERAHPEFPLVIYNYTPLCQFSRAWDDVTKMCRGLIVHRDTGEVIARPFPKFFNYEEHLAAGDPLPDEVPDVYAKMDGSLGILYWWGGKPYIATRGSFTSDQAIWATAWLNSHVERARCLGVPHFSDCTLLFEIIGPQNRIVVAYGKPDLVLLAVVNKETGRAHRNLDVEGFTHVQKYNFTSYAELKALDTANEEGFVFHYPKSDLRVKLKFDEYARLHKIVTGLSTIGVWEWLRDGKDPYTQDVPDEMLPWLKGVVEDLRAQFSIIHSEALLGYRASSNYMASSDPKEDRKRRAAIVMVHKHPSIVFAMIDGKDWHAAVWRMIRPSGSTTFRQDIDS